MSRDWYGGGDGGRGANVERWIGGGGSGGGGMREESEVAECACTGDRKGMGGETVSSGISL